MEKTLYLFMMFSIVGWLWETPWVSIRTKKFTNRGFLRGPYIPIYGSAVVTIIFAMQIFDNVLDANILIILLEMIYMGLITAVWEFLTSWGLEKVFHTRWWDYSTHKYNIQGRISLSVSIFFGVGGYILWRFVLEPFEWIYNELPSNVMLVVLSVFYVIFISDAVITLIDLFKVRNIMQSIEKISKELGEEVEVKIADLRKEFQVRKSNLYNSIVDVKNQLVQRYEEVPDTSVSKRLRLELNKLSNKLLKGRSLSRFYKKFPNSYSIELLGVKKRIKQIQEAIKK